MGGVAVGDVGGVAHELEVAIGVLVGAVTFSGSVVDQFGGSISGATVALTNSQNSQKYEVRSNSIGVFEFVGLMTGEYELSASRPGFRTAKDRLTITGRNYRV